MISNIIKNLPDEMKNDKMLGKSLYTINKKAKRLRDIKRDLYAAQKGGGYTQLLADYIGAEYDPDSYELGYRDSSDVLITPDNIEDKIHETQKLIDEAEYVLDDDEATEDEKETAEEDIDFYSDYLKEYKKINEKFEKLNMLDFKINENDLYNLKNDVLKKRNPKVVKYHQFPKGDIRPLYSFGGFNFHGDATELPEGFTAEEIDEISAENNLPDNEKISDEEAENYLKKYLSGENF